jgi:hypothetical protein
MKTNLTIHKKILEIVDEQEIEVPEKSDFLSVDNQEGKICVWYRCNPENPLIKIKIFIRGTGHFNVPELNDSFFLGTVILLGGGLVFHVFMEY